MYVPWVEGLTEKLSEQESNVFSFDFEIAEDDPTIPGRVAIETIEEEGEKKEIQIRGVYWFMVICSYPEDIENNVMNDECLHLLE